MPLAKSSNAARLGNGRDLQIVQISKLPVEPTNCTYRMLLACGARPLIVATCVPIVQIGRAGRLDVEAGRVDQRCVRVVGVNRINRRVVVAEFVRAEERQVVGLRRVQLLDFESGSAIVGAPPG